MERNTQAIVPIIGLVTATMQRLWRKSPAQARLRDQINYILVNARAALQQSQDRVVKLLAIGE